jgi:integrase
MGKLTDVEIRKAIKATLPVALSDGDGLTLTLSKAGTATWILRYRLAGKQKELTLGRYPELSLKTARELATEKRGAVQQGIDVGREKQKALRETASSWTFKRLAEDYLERASERLAENTIYGRKQQLRDYVYPSIGHVAAADVSPAEIVSITESASKRSQHVARLVLIAIREVFAHGIARHVVTSNPCSHIKASAIIGGTRHQRQRVSLSDGELASLFKALPSLSVANQCLTRILLTLGTRITETVTAQWAHIDFDNRTWTIPPENSKTSREFVIPFPPSIADVLSELKQMSFGSQYVFPIRTRFKGNEDDDHAEATTLNAALAKLCRENQGAFRAFSPHDLRATCRSHLTALGVELAVAERCLNHSLGGLIAVYDRSDYLPQRRRALELWAAKLSSIEAGEVFKVVPLKVA